MKTIVVGVDGSECADKALTWAVGEARLRGDRVRAVHAWEYPVNGAAYGLMAPQLGRDERRDAAKATLDEAVEPLRNGVQIDEVLVEGAAAKALLRASEDADLVVVGSRGLGGFRRLLLGSVSTQLAHHSRCPVVIVREDEVATGR
jgi:nucleotide-binding universal stress UspA family protein